MVCNAFLSEDCSLVVTCWERANLLALLCVMFYCVMSFSCITLVNVNAPVVAITSWWLHFSAQVVALKVKKSIPVDFMIYL